MMAYQTIYPYTNEVLRSYESLSDAGVEKALEQAYGQYQGLAERQRYRDSEKQSCARWLPCSGGIWTGMQKP
jgi:succinate-semialdehyde dehydrogenase / glutarate-semialdehyde dehydrogenase